VKLFRQLFILAFVISAMPIAARAQLWSGVIDPSRAIDWTSAGFPGVTPPDAAWTQCGSTIAPYGSSGAPASGSTITNATAACSNDQYVQLGAGTFYINDDFFVAHDYVVARGVPGATFFVMSGHGGCLYNYAAVCLDGGSNNGPDQAENICDWTAGYAPNTTVVTLAHCGAYVGTVNTNGTSVTLVSGDNFGLKWNISPMSGAITINGTSYSISAINSPTSITLGASAGTQSNVSYSVTSAGSASNLKVGGLLVLDQADDATDTASIFNCNGPQVGTPQFWASCVGGGPSVQGYQAGFDRTFGPCVGNWSCSRGQEQIVVITNVATSGGSCSSATPCVTVSPAVRMPNWRAGQQPGAWFATNSITERGLEDVSIDNTNTANHNDAVEISNCYKCWVKGIRSVYPARAHVAVISSKNAVIENNYFYQGQSHQAVSYAAEFNGAADDVFVNNICQQVTDSCPNNNGPESGDVRAYNLALDLIFADNNFFVTSEYQHGGGDYFNLHEGNMMSGFNSDSIHGTHQLETFFRGMYIGNQNAGCGDATTGNVCNNGNEAMAFFASSRYYNVIGNVIGDPGRNTLNVYSYDANVTQSTSHGQAPGCTANGGGCDPEFQLGYTDNVGWSYNGNYNNTWCQTSACSATEGYDSLTGLTLMRWGNWDAVTNAVRWCGNSSDTGWSTTCGSASEVPANLWNCNASTTVCNGNVTFSNPVPSLGDTSAGQAAMPPSFYFTGGTVGTGCGHSNLPFGKNPTTGYCPGWPIMGPDVTSGNVGRCSGGTYAFMQASLSSDCSPGGGTLITAFGGHANEIPALECYLHVMNGPPDGTGNALNFNESLCYANDPTGTVASQPIAPATVNATVTSQP
jgi:hypothetical protein